MQSGNQTNIHTSNQTVIEHTRTQKTTTTHHIQKQKTHTQDSNTIRTHNQTRNQQRYQLMQPTKQSKLHSSAQSTNN